MMRDVSTRWFRWSLAGIAAVALAVRLLYIFQSRQYIKFGGDAFFYHAGANLLADGRGFIWPFTPHRSTPTAGHPPLYLVYLAIPSFFGFTSQLTHLLWSAFLGVGTVVVIGLVGREVRSERVGVIAAAIAAIYPNIWVPDGSLMAETVAMFATAVALLFAYRYWRDHRWSQLALVGLASGAAALSRSELVLMIPFLVLPLAVFVPGPTRRQRWIALGAGSLAALALMSPWMVLNLTRFEKPELLSTQFGALLASTDCGPIWNGGVKSYFSVECAAAIKKRELKPGDDESVADAAYRKAGIKYITHHMSLIPGVAAARLGAILGVYHRDVQIFLDGVIEGRGDRLARIGLYSFQGLAILSVAGGILVRRRREVPVFPLVVLPVIVLFIVVGGYASTRFRSPAEVVLCILSAVALDAGFDAVKGLRNTGPAVDSEPAVP
jgi:4-amino-4-deoxy-L-arabinose transferase and related glycosyltransferases of PMT family